MTKKKLALLQTVRDQILSLDREILLLELDRKVLHKELFNLSITDETPEITEEAKVILEPMPEEEKAEVLADTVLLKGDKQ